MLALLLLAGIWVSIGPEGADPMAWLLPAAVPAAVFYLLDRFFRNAKSLTFENERLAYSSKRKGVIYQVPARDIQALSITYTLYTGHRLCIYTAEGARRIKLSWTWIWRIPELEKRISRICEAYRIKPFPTRHE